MKKLFLLLSIFCALIFQLDAAHPLAKKLPEKLISRNGKPVDPATLEGKIVGVYFSAAWCGPCRGFTPQLVKFYNNVKKNDGKFEIIFISSDKTPKAMMDYMKNDKMPWLAAPHNDSRAMALRNELGVNGIPTLVIYGADGKLISKNARWDVVMLGTKALKAWQSPKYTPKTYQDYQDSLKGKQNNTQNSKKKSNKKKR